MVTSVTQPAQNVNPTQQVVQNFQSQVANQTSQQPSQSPPPQQNQNQPMTQPQMVQTQQSPTSSSQSGQPPSQGQPQQSQGQQQQNPMQQLHPANTPSPLESLQTLDLNHANLMSSILSGGQLPDVINISDLNTVMNHINALNMGNQGTPTPSKPPQGFDSKSGYGFLPGQCTAYASWYLNDVLGVPFKDTGNGNAKNWPAMATAQGLNVTDTPQVGSVVVWPKLGDNGHVAVVTGVNQNGTINVSEYNYKPGTYSDRSNVSTSGTVYISK